MSNYRALIFDFDGVITLSEPIHYEAIIKAVKPFGMDLDYDTYAREYIGLSDLAAYKKLFANNQRSYDKNQVNDIISEKTKFYEILSKELKACEGVMELVREAQKLNWELAVCSAARRDDLNAVLPYLNEGELNKHFKVIVSGDDMPHGKATPEGYLLTAQKLNVDPTTCVVIEDSPTGIRAAKRAGMYVLGITTSYSKPLLKEADQIVNSLLEISLSKLVDIT